MRGDRNFVLPWGCGFALLLGLSGGFAQAPHGTPAPGRWQPPAPPKGWTAPEVRGYGDGVKAGWMDLAAGVKAHPERQVLYQTPPVKVDQRYFYREGFRKGYDVVYAHERGDGTQPAGAKQG